MRKAVVLVVAALVLVACSAKSVEVATETTMDPTVTAVATTVKTDRIYQCTLVMQEAMAGIETTLKDGSIAYATGKAGMAQARDAAIAAAVTTAAKCQLLLPECATPASEWVQGVKTYADTFAANLLRLDYGSSLIPMVKPQPSVDGTCI
jgi:hypothetical protein